MADNCAICGDKFIGPNDEETHHISYEPEKTIQLCSSCHQRVHQRPGFHDELKPELSRDEAKERGLIKGAGEYRNTEDTMKVTTIRLPEPLLDDLEEESSIYGFSNRTEYIRWILNHRGVIHEHTENTEANVPAGGDVSDRLKMLEEDVGEIRGRLDRLEDRLDAEAAERRAERVESETTHGSDRTPPATGSPDGDTDSAPTRDANDDARQLVEDVAEREGWDDDGRLEARKAAAAAAVRALRERGELGKSDAVDDLGLFDEFPVPGQDAETWWRRNCRPVLGEIAEYSRGVHGYVLDEDDDSGVYDPTAEF